MNEARSSHTLTPKQLAFANAILEGTGPSDAYRKAGYATGSPAVVSVKAQEVLKHPDVAAYIAAGKAKTAAQAEMTRNDKLRALEDTIRGTKRLDSAQIKALEVHNLMTGDNAPQEVNVFGLSDLLAVVRKGRR